MHLLIFLNIYTGWNLKILSWIDAFGFIPTTESIKLWSAFKKCGWLRINGNGLHLLVLNIPLIEQSSFVELQNPNY